MKSELDLDHYVEEKPYFIKLLLWRVVNVCLYKVVTNIFRRRLMKWFGAKVGPWSSVFATLRVYAPWNLEFKDHCCFGPGVEIYNKAQVIIADNVIISQGAYLCTASHDITSSTMSLVTKPIRICSKVWIGARATILPGVTIGEGAVVGACAVVAKDVPPWSVVVGNPARVVKKRELK